MPPHPSFHVPTPTPDLLSFPPAPDPTHSRLVSALVHLLFGLGFREIETLPLRPSTTSESAYRPDVIARSGQNTRSHFVVETADSLQSAGSSQRLLALARESSGTDFWLAVPPDARPSALRRLKDLEIRARVIGL